MVIVEVNPSFEIRRVIVPLEQQVAQIGTQPQNLEIVLAGPEGTKTRTEAARPEGTLVTKAQVDAIPAIEATIISIPMQNLTLPTFQDIPATRSAAKTLLLLTTGPRFDKTVIEATPDSAKSLTAHTEKLPSKEPSRTQDNVLPNVAEV